MSIKCISGVTTALVFALGMGAIAPACAQQQKPNILVIMGDDVGWFNIGARLANRGHSGADRQFAGDEIGAAGGAARFGIIVGESRAL